MVLIFSEPSDVTTLFVIDWLIAFNKDYLIIYPESFIEISSIEVNNKEGVRYVLTKCENENYVSIQYSEITSVWFRRGLLSPKNFRLNIKSTEKIATEMEISNKLKEHLKSEYDSVINFIYDTLNKKRHLNDFFKSKINKNATLALAQECGLMIPHTKIITSKKELERFSQKNKIILKSVQELFYIKFQGEYFCNYTEILSEESILNTSSNFFPTLFQEYIEKDFEIRVFYIDNCCFSMAIFSQNDKQTKTDFRKYNFKTPNRTVPYNLPQDIEEKINKLMTGLGLNSGSLDIIKTKKNEYIFLEVNPVGQFGMVSAPCNYFLEKRVANYLI